MTVREGSYEGPRFSERDGVTRYFSDYQPAELAASLADNHFVVTAQASDRVGPSTWLQTVCLAQE